MWQPASRCCHAQFPCLVHQHLHVLFVCCVVWFFEVMLIVFWQMFRICLPECVLFPLVVFLFCFLCIFDTVFEPRFALGLHYGTLLRPLGYLLAPFLCLLATFWAQKLPKRDYFFPPGTPWVQKAKKAEKGTFPAGKG